MEFVISEELDKAARVLYNIDGLVCFVPDYVGCELVYTAHIMNENLKLFCDKILDTCNNIEHNFINAKDLINIVILYAILVCKYLGNGSDEDIKRGIRINDDYLNYIVESVNHAYDLYYECGLKPSVYSGESRGSYASYITKIFTINLSVEIFEYGDSVERIFGKL